MFQPMHSSVFLPSFGEGGLSYVTDGLVLDLTSNFTEANAEIQDKSPEDNDAILYSGRYATTDGVNDTINADCSAHGLSTFKLTGKVRSATTGAKYCSIDGWEVSLTVTSADVWQDFETDDSTDTLNGVVVVGYGAFADEYSAADWSDLRLIDVETGEVVAHWPLTESSDGTADGLDGLPCIDSSGNGYHGAYVGCSAATGEGIDADVAREIRDGIYFPDSLTHYAQAAGFRPFTAGSAADFSVVCPKFNGDNIGSGDTSKYMILSVGAPVSGSSSYGGFSIYVRASGDTNEIYAKWQTAGDTSEQALAVGTNNYYKGEHQITFVFDADSGTAMYDNGVLVASGSAPTRYPKRSGSNGDFRLGCQQTFQVSDTFLGVLERDCAFYSHTLTAAQVASIYDSGISAVPTYTLGYNMDIVGGVIADLSGNGWDGDPNNLLTVGQKRETILQTAGQDWNKYSWFNGAEWATGASISSISNSGNFSLSFNWFSSSDVNTSQYLLANIINSSNRFTLAISTGSKLSAYFWNGSTYVKGTTISFLPDTFYAVTLVHDGTDITINLNGGDSGAFTGLNFRDNSGFSIGGRVGGSTALKSGSISNVRVYSDDSFTTQVAGYTGLGNSPWLDTISSADLAENGTFTRHMIPASDTTPTLDAYGTAIANPRPNSKVLNLFGEGEYANSGNDASLDVTTAATWEIWGNFYGVGDDRALLSKYVTTGNQRSWLISKDSADPADEVSLRISNDGLVTTAVSIENIPDATIQLTIVYDGTTTAKYYINAVEYSVAGVDASPIYTSTSDISVGNGVGLTWPHDKQIGSAKLYPTALTAAEVLQNYDAQKSQYGL